MGRTVLIPIRNPVKRLKWHLATHAYLGTFFEDTPSFRTLLKERRQQRRQQRVEASAQRASCRITFNGSGAKVVNVLFDDGRSLQALVEPPSAVMSPQMQKLVDDFVPSRRPDMSNVQMGVVHPLIES